MKPKVFLVQMIGCIAQETCSAMIEFSYNSIMEWLKSQGEEQKAFLLL